MKERRKRLLTAPPPDVRKVSDFPIDVLKFRGYALLR